MNKSQAVITFAIATSTAAVMMGFTVLGEKLKRKIDGTNNER
jgi:hypothetical protein